MKDFYEITFKRVTYSAAYSHRHVVQCVRWRPNCQHFAPDVLIFTHVGPAMLSLKNSGECLVCFSQRFYAKSDRLN